MLSGLLRVTQKLDGYQEGEILSVEGQVQQLLHDAQDEENLSKMYHGWAACRLCKMECYIFHTLQKFTEILSSHRFLSFCFTFSSKNTILSQTCIFSSADYNGRQDGSQQSLHFFRWECARGNEQRWQGEVVAAAAKKQETFSLILKAVEEIFRIAFGERGERPVRTEKKPKISKKS